MVLVVPPLLAASWEVGPVVIMTNVLVTWAVGWIIVEITLTTHFGMRIVVLVRTDLYIIHLLSIYYLFNRVWRIKPNMLLCHQTLPGGRGHLHL